jgi:hypothetical protein
MPPVLPRTAAPSGLVFFDLPAIFRCSVELGAAISNETDLWPDRVRWSSVEWQLLAGADEGAIRRLKERSDAADRCETAMVRLKAVLNSDWS